MLTPEQIFDFCLAKTDQPRRGYWDGWQVSIETHIAGVTLADRSKMEKAARYTRLLDERGCLEAMQGRR